MTLVGFRRATIQILDKDLKPVAEKKFVIEGVTNKGATSAFEISGLSPEAIKVYGSNIPYWVSQKGTGDLAVTVSMLDLPMEVENELLGIVAADNGVHHLGDDTEAPYAAILFESSNMQGEKIGVGLYAGKFSRESLKAETLKGEKTEPEADEYGYTPISKQFGEQSYSVGYAYSDEQFTALEEELFGKAVVK